MASLGHNELNSVDEKRGKGCSPHNKTTSKGINKFHLVQCSANKKDKAVFEKICMILHAAQNYTALKKNAVCTIV